MKHKFLSLVAATCMLGFMVASANAMDPLSGASMSTISAKGVNVSNGSYVDLSGSQNSASGIVIADLSSSAVNNQANYIDSYVNGFLSQQNHGKAINKVKSEESSVSQASSVSLDNSENSASGLMIVNASSSAANNQLNAAYTASTLAQTNRGKAINIISGEENVSNGSYVGLSNGSQNSASGIVIADLSSSAANNQANFASKVYSVSQENHGKAINKVKSEGKVSQTSGVNLNGSENFASGLMIVNASSSAANNQLNVAYNTVYLAQTNMGKAINIISGGTGKPCDTTGNPAVSESSGVVLTDSEGGAKGLMIANMSSSAANTQLNVASNVGSCSTGCNFTPQMNSGLAVNVISGH